jgi:hypothetical protein
VRTKCRMMFFAHTLLRWIPAILQRMEAISRVYMYAYVYVCTLVDPSASVCHAEWSIRVPNYWLIGHFLHDLKQVQVSNNMDKHYLQ